MDPLQVIGEEVAVKSSPLSYLPGAMTTDSLKFLEPGPTVFFTGPTSVLPIRDLGTYNVDNTALIHHSVYSNIRAPHTFVDRIQHTYVPTIIDDYKFFRISNNVFYFPIDDGANVAHWEEANSEFLPWKEACEGNKAVSTTPKKAFRGIIVAAHETVADPQLNKYATDYAYDGPLNELGANLSRAWNLRWVREQLKGTREYANFIEFLSENGYDEPAEEKGYAVGFLPSKAVAGIRNNVLHVNRNYSGIIKSWAKQYGVPEEIIEAYVLAMHEPAHLGGLPGGVSGESELEEIIERFADELAQNEQSGMPHNTANYRTSGRRTGYRQIASIARQRASEVLENYGGKGLFKFSKAEVMEAAERYTNGALEEGIEDVEDYVARRLKEDYDGSNANAETSKEENGKSSETLESRVEGNERNQDNSNSAPEEEAEALDEAA